MYGGNDRKGVAPPRKEEFFIFYPKDLAKQKKLSVDSVLSVLSVQNAQSPPVLPTSAPLYWTAPDSKQNLKKFLQHAQNQPRHDQREPDPADRCNFFFQNKISEECTQWQTQLTERLNKAHICHIIHCNQNKNIS